MGNLYHWNGTAWQAGDGTTVPPGGGGSAPAAPTNITVTAGNATVTVGWDAVTGADSYTVYRSTTSGSGHTSLQTGITGTSHADATAVNDTAYYYVVTAVNTNGESGQSLEVGAKPAAAGSAALSFSPVTGSVANGANITVAVMVDSGAGQMDTVQARVVFDPAQFSHVSTDYSLSDFDTDAPDGSGTGFIEMVRGSTVALTGSNTLGHATFQAQTGSGTALLKFGMADTDVILSGTGQAIGGTFGQYTLTA